MVLDDNVTWTTPGVPPVLKNRRCDWMLDCDVEKTDPNVTVVVLGSTKTADTDVPAFAVTVHVDVPGQALHPANTQPKDGVAVNVI